jgi:hypothetical protein
MNSVGFLQSYTEVAIAIIGFSGVVVALKGRDATELQNITLSMLILFGSASLVLGILPQILLEMGISSARIWQGISLVIVISTSGARVARGRQAKAKGTDITELGGIGFVPIMLTSTIIAAMNVYFGLFWLYMSNLLLYLLASIAIFRRLIGLGNDA